MDSNRKVDTVNVEDDKGELHVVQEDKTTLLSAKYRQRQNGVVSFTNDGKLGLPNLGLEYEGSEEIEKDCSNDASGHRKQKPSAAFSMSTESVEKASTVAESCQGGRDKAIDSVEGGSNPSVSEDKREVSDHRETLELHPSKKKSPKSMKDWLRDPNLYKVCHFLYRFYNHINDKINSPVLCDKPVFSNNLYFFKQRMKIKCRKLKNYNST